MCRLKNNPKECFLLKRVVQMRNLALLTYNTILSRMQPSFTTSASVFDAPPPNVPPGPIVQRPLPRASSRINIDSLFERQRQQEERQNKRQQQMLERVHKQIKHCSRGSNPLTSCWFRIPVVLVGPSRYNPEACTAFLIHHLRDNGFQVEYYPPNTLYICWSHCVPGYVRDELRRETGVVVDSIGRLQQPEEETEVEAELAPPQQKRRTSDRSRPRKSVGFVEPQQQPPPQIQPAAPAYNPDTYALPFDPRRLDGRPKLDVDDRGFVPMTTYRAAGVGRAEYSSEMLNTQLSYHKES